MSELILLLVLHHSLTVGTPASDCADALRRLTGNVFERAAITHVTELDARLTRWVDREVDLVRIAGGGLAYTIQGPRNEVAIVVCAPQAPTPPAPATSSTTPPSS